MEPLPRHKAAEPPTTTTQTTHRSPSFHRQSSNPNNRRRIGTAHRSKPPSQERLVVAFITASALFALSALSPFLLGNFPIDNTSTRNGNKDASVEWFHRHGDGKGGVLELAGNKTLLAWHRFVGRQQQQQQQQQHNHDVQVVNGDPQNNVNEGYYSNGDHYLPLERGVSGLPLSQTPALIGAKHGSITCPSTDGTPDRHMDELAYWNDPQGESDVSFVSPFAASKEQTKKYVTFEPDHGGWNNIRMSMEIVFVFAAVTGRTLVLPPDTPFYLLKAGESHHGFADFMNLNHEGLNSRMEIITMKEFLEREGSVEGSGNGGKIFTIPSGKEGEKIRKSSEYCYYMAKSDRSCDSIYNFLASVGYVPEIQAGRDCLIFDEQSMTASTSTTVLDLDLLSALQQSKQQDINQFCGKRNPIFFGNELASAQVIHFHAGEKHHRLLNHFYTFLHFTDPKVDHYYKRFVRDFLHYVDTIFCAAGKVIQMLEEEAASSGGNYGNVGEPRYSALHVRRGDFQYKKVKLSAEEWYENTKELFRPNEIIYVATDEKDKTFFEPLAKHYNLHFLNEYTEVAGLDKLDANYAGMIDTIVASRGRLFVGTWFSTFTGYIVSFHRFCNKRIFIFGHKYTCEKQPSLLTLSLSLLKRILRTKEPYERLSWILWKNFVLRINRTQIQYP